MQRWEGEGLVPCRHVDVVDVLAGDVVCRPLHAAADIPAQAHLQHPRSFTARATGRQWAGLAVDVVAADGALTVVRSHNLYEGGSGEWARAVGGSWEERGLDHVDGVAMVGVGLRRDAPLDAVGIRVDHLRLQVRRLPVPLMVDLPNVARIPSKTFPFPQAERHGLTNRSVLCVLV